MAKKVALITGAAAGMGKVIAMRLAKDGFDVAINDINEALLQETCKEIEEFGTRCIALKADVSDTQQVQEMYEKLISAYGRIDVLINNAGICPVGDILEHTPEEFSRCMRINTDALFICSHYAIPHMIKQGGGRIINAASTGSFSQSGLQVAYCTSKWAVRGFTRSMASALAKYNINVNAYAPGATDTPMQNHICEKASKELGVSLEEYKKSKVGKIPIGRWIKEEEIAGLVSYLASDEASAITGQSILIDGGTVMN